VELTIAYIDQTLTPTYGVIGAAYELLLESTDDAVDDALGKLDATRADLARVARRCLDLRRFEANGPAGFDALCVLTFIIGNWGRDSGANRAGFEFELRREATKAGDKPLYVPFWVPSVAGINQTDLLFPIVAAKRTRALRAYEGLVHHLRSLTADASEVALTAVLWRVAALSDGLARDSGGTAARFNALRFQVAQDPTISDHEKRLWNPLTTRFVHSRDALTHMICEREGVVHEVFETAVEYVLAQRHGLVPAASALGLAVLQEIAVHLSDMDAPTVEWERVQREHLWIDDQA